MIGQRFGKLIKDYDKARRGYPRGVFAYLRKLEPGRNLKVLDIGCGTGIATRQLKESKFDVVGSDIDKAMINLAKKKGGGIKYIVAPASKLPFPDASFDVVTAFTAFHWFEDKKSLREIKRVLKPGGLFFTVLKQNSGRAKWKKVQREYRDLIHKYTGGKFNSFSNYFPAKVLKANGFARIKTEDFYFDEKYSINDALVLQKSFSHWHNIPSKKSKEYLEEMRTLYQKHFPKGVVTRDRVAEVVAGRNLLAKS